MQPPYKRAPPAPPAVQERKTVTSADRVGDRMLPPLEDPAEALRFCRAVASALEPASDGERHALTPANFAAMMGQAEPSTGRPELSVIIPVFNEAENLPTLHGRLTRALVNLGMEYEIVLVDDGSQDQSPDILRRMEAEDQRIVIVEFARNFGHQVAISAGLEQSRGRVVCIMDADLQDPPEVLHTFLAKWREGWEVVYAIRTERKEWWGKRLAYAGFYRLLQRVANIDIPLDAGDFCVMDRRVVDLLVRMPERNRFVRGIRSWVGFKQIGVPYERHARHAGAPKYTFRKLLYLALDGLISFSHMPLRIITLLGFSVSFLSFLVALFYLVKKFTLGTGVPGFTTLVVSIFFLSGIQLMTIGVIGEYIGRISDEVKRRPLYVARRVTRR
ncbi:MAG: glycosyltransferase [Nitrospira sp.]|uniref:Glycosyl transferase, family 2 n=1 Tax=Nitrospira defluvii TaxID=330214 RepID=D8PB97_9BACT|nr:glycosyltransferase [Nitrospira sp.]CBK40506.1 Glycosyl transferase, family 2 [Nitrospira defluvii]